MGKYYRCFLRKSAAPDRHAVAMGDAGRDLLLEVAPDTG